MVVEDFFYLRFQVDLIGLERFVVYQDELIKGGHLRILPPELVVKVEFALIYLAVL